MYKKLEKDTIETVLTKIPVMIFSFLYSIFLIRLLGPEGNGIFAFITASVTLSILILGFNAKGSTVYHLSSEKFDSNKVFGLALVIHLVAIVIIMLFCLCIFYSKSSISYLLIPEEYFSLFYLLFFIGSFILQFLSGLFAVVFTALKQFRIFNFFLFASHLLQVIVYGAGYFFSVKADQSLGLVSIFLIILLVQFIIAILSLILFIKYSKLKIDFQFKSIRNPFLKYASLGYVSVIGNFLNKRLDIWFIEIFSGLKSLGFYALSTQLTNFLLLMVTPLNLVLKPYLININREEGNKIFSNYFKAIFYMMSLAALFLCIISGFIVPLLFGTEFLPAILPLRILCLGIVFTAIKQSIMNYNKAYNDLKYNVWGQWFGVLVTLILDLLLIPKYGIIGAAWASVAAYGSSSFLVGSILLFKQDISLSQLIIPTKSDYMWARNMIGSMGGGKKS
jgi:O-antigen/teichoic acid export membrane protein